jgi:RimJ/RimL family protein N-acetyltransferase
MVLLETGRLRLQQFTAADVDRLVELDSDPEVMRYVTYGVPTPREVYLEEILPRWLRIYRETPLLGYRLRRASWGRGLATEGASAPRAAVPRSARR